MRSEDGRVRVCIPLWIVGKQSLTWYHYDHRCGAAAGWWDALSVGEEYEMMKDTAAWAWRMTQDAWRMTQDAWRMTHDVRRVTQLGVVLVWGGPSFLPQCMRSFLKTCTAWYVHPQLHPIPQQYSKPSFTLRAICSQHYHQHPLHLKAVPCNVHEALIMPHYSSPSCTANFVSSHSLTIICSKVYLALPSPPFSSSIPTPFISLSLSI